jgi:hypothetical protein
LKRREYTEKCIEIAIRNEKKNKKLRTEEVSGKIKMCDTK